MSNQPHSEQYERVRKDFDDLSIQDRAVFLIEATVTTIARGLEQAGTVLADELDKAFRMRPEPAGEGPASPGAGGSSAGTRKRRPQGGTGTGEGHNVDT